jgi:hypothetical protein
MPMKRTSILITDTNGTKYDANHISIERDHTSNGGAVSVISFLCSGERITLSKDRIRSIEFAEATWCSECDWPIQILGPLEIPDEEEHADESGRIP